MISSTVRIKRRWLVALGTTIACCTNAAGQPMEWVTVGNPGNEPDESGFYGAVDYVYRIGKYEVTNSQYVEFLNAKAALGDPFGLYNPEMATDPHGGIDRGGNGTPRDPHLYETRPNMANKPVNYVSWFDAMRFANWQHNGGGEGDTETGAYTTGGQARPIGQVRNEGARVFLPTVLEWGKAAYHDPTQTRRYRWYACGNEVPPTQATASSIGDISNPGFNVANYSQNANWNGSTVGNVTTVGSAGPDSESFYFTSDQTGNVWEWNEWDRGPLFRGLAGASFIEGRAAVGSWSIAGSASTSIEVLSFGFRVAHVVPLGDVNCDGTVDARDIEPFIVALFDPEGYSQTYSDCDINLADLNGDEVVDALDIGPFLEVLFAE